MSIRDLEGQQKESSVSDTSEWFGLKQEESLISQNDCVSADSGKKSD